MSDNDIIVDTAIDVPKTFNDPSSEGREMTIGANGPKAPKGPRSPRNYKLPKFRIKKSYLMTAAIVVVVIVCVYILTLSIGSSSASPKNYSNIAFSFSYPNNWVATSLEQNTSSSYSALLLPASVENLSAIISNGGHVASENFSSIIINATPESVSSFDSLSKNFTAGLNGTKNISVGGIEGLEGSNSFISNSIIQIAFAHYENITYIITGIAIGASFVTQEEQAFNEVLQTIKVYHYAFPNKLITPSRENITLPTEVSGFKPFNVTEQDCSVSKGFQIDLENTALVPITINQVAVEASIGMNTSTNSTVVQGASVAIPVGVNDSQIINESQNFGSLPIGCTQVGNGYRANITITYVEFILGQEQSNYAFGTVSGDAIP